MADVQLSGVAPAGGAATAGLTGSGGTVASATQAASPPPSAPGSTGSTAGVSALAQVAGSVVGQPDATHTGTAQPKPVKPDDREVKDAVKNANQALAAIGTQLVFVFDDQTHHLSVKLLDIQTQKVVQEIPTAAMRATANALSGPSASGSLVDTKA